MHGMPAYPSCELAQTLQGGACITVACASPETHHPFISHEVSPFLQIIYQIEQTIDDCLCNKEPKDLCWIPFLEKRKYESLLSDFRYNTLVCSTHTM